MTDRPWDPDAVCFYTAVWYAARKAEQAFLDHQRAVEAGTPPHQWKYLAGALDDMEAEAERIPYRVMREDLASFANTFGLSRTTQPKKEGTTMKVNIYETVEVSDEERFLIGAFFDGPDAKRRPATRDEMKEFIWTYGKNWVNGLHGFPEDQPIEEDLVGENTLEGEAVADADDLSDLI
jgi:hypothetical protein